MKRCIVKITGRMESTGSRIYLFDVFASRSGASQVCCFRMTIDSVSLDVYNQLISNQLTAPNDAEAKAKGLCIVPAIDAEELGDSHGMYLMLRVPQWCVLLKLCIQYSRSSLETRTNFHPVKRRYSPLQPTPFVLTF